MDTRMARELLQDMRDNPPPLDDGPEDRLNLLLEVIEITLDDLERKLASGDTRAAQQEYTELFVRVRTTCRRCQGKLQGASKTCCNRCLLWPYNPYNPDNHGGK